MSYRRHWLAAGLLALASSFASFQAAAQQAPVRLVVPFAAGGAADILARQVAPLLGNGLKQTVIVENRVGATGAIAAEHVAGSPPDGLTVLVGSSSLMTASPNLSKSLRYDPVKGFAPLSLLGTVDVIVSVHPGVPARSIQELVAYAKANPKKVSYASSGIGSTLHLASELFSQQAGIQMTHVPYKGEAPAAQDLVGGHVDLMFVNFASAVPMIQAKQIRPLGVASLRRHPDFPDLPTIAESGFPGFQSTIWIALFLPAKTPQPIIDRMHGALMTAMGEASVKERIKGLGMLPATSTPQELADRVRDDLARWGRVVRDAGIPVE
ncbi:MAG: Bug family tripartite tricarboxylate transporter substrate binding protein [Lautropia sp.]